MIEVRDVRVSYPGADAPALDRVSLSVAPGEVVALAGANGSGKSTLASLLCAMRLADEGTILVDGVDPAAGRAERAQVRRVVGLVRQHPLDQLVSTVVFDEVAFGPRNLGLSAADVRARVERALACVGLADALGRDVSSLSGGQQQLLAIAGVLAMESTYLVLDEASSMLDSSARPAHRALAARLAREMGVGVIQVTHDPLEILASDRVVVLERGWVAFEGSPRSLVCEHESLLGDTVVPSHVLDPLRAVLTLGWEPAALGEGTGPLDPSVAVSWLVAAYEVGRVSERDVRAVLALLEGAAPESGSDGATGDGGAFGVGPDALEVHSGHVPVGAAGGTAETRRDVSGSALVLNGVTFAYGGEAPALRDVSLELRTGEVLLVAGRSGSGKSTLACVAAGLYPADAGTVALAGAPVRPGSVGVAFQRPEDQLFCESVRDEIAFAPRNLGCSEEEAARRVERAAALVGLDADLLDRYPFDLSGGQARRVAIASVLSLEAGAYLLDEPTAGLDAAGRAHLHGLARTLANDGAAVCVISHDLEEWLDVADRVALMAHGAVTWCGTAAQLVREPEAFGRAGLRPPLALELAGRLRRALAGEGSV